MTTNKDDADSDDDDDNADDADNAHDADDDNDDNGDCGDDEGEVEYHCRLAVPVTLVMRDGTRVKVSALVDTGSEVNLVRRGLLDDCHSRPCGPGVSFYALNQQLLGGNQRQVSCDLIMQVVEQDTEGRHKVGIPSEGI